MTATPDDVVQLAIKAYRGHQTQEAAIHSVLTAVAPFLQGVPLGYSAIPQQPTDTMLETMAFNLSSEFGFDFTLENKAFAMAVYKQAWTLGIRFPATTPSQQKSETVIPATDDIGKPITVLKDQLIKDADWLGEYGHQLHEECEYHDGGHTANRLQAIGERITKLIEKTDFPEDSFKGTVDGDTPLQAAAREAGWALIEVVDEIDWLKREKVSDIITNLGIALNEPSPTAPDYTDCVCTKIQQDESCPVGYPSLLCEVCGGKGVVPYVKLDGPELWEIVFGIADEVAHEISDEQYTKIAETINSVFIDTKPSPRAQALEEGDLNSRLKAKGMYTVDEMMGALPFDKWRVHSGMTDLKFFGEWLERKAREYLTMKAAYDAGDKDESDELYEWVLAHYGAFHDVLVNFRAALEGQS